jgi:transposase
MYIMSLLNLENIVLVEQPNMYSDKIQLKLATATTSAACSVCGHYSSGVHNHYTRKVRDLPWASYTVCISLVVKRFRCHSDKCARKIFSEPVSFLPAYARRTKRMTKVLAQIGFGLGGQAGAYLANLLGMPLSDTTLTRLLCKVQEQPIAIPKVLGVDKVDLTLRVIDPRAIKKGVTYGTILVDLEKGQPIDLLTNREADTLSNWLKAHPGVEIITRDRASAYANGAACGAPNAIQVADRWHLLRNMGEALKKMMEKATPQIRKAAETIAENNKQQKQHELEGIPIIGHSVSLSSPTALRAMLFKEAKRLNISRTTVTKYQALAYYPARYMPPDRRSGVLPWREYLIERWNQGERNIKKLWREIYEQGYRGAAGSVYRFFDTVPKDTVKFPDIELEIKNWTPTKVQYLLCKADDQLSQEEKQYLSVLIEQYPPAQCARRLALTFRKIFELKEAKLLRPWIAEAKESHIPALKNFATGLESDYTAVEAAATYEWSNGQVEGQINRLKTIKRQMYGRAGFDLLRKRVIFHSYAA